MSDGNPPLFPFIGVLPMLCLCALLAFSACTPAKDEAKPRAGLENAVVLVIRHAEKPDKGVDLSKAGEKRAKAYVGYFKNFKVGSAPLQLSCLFAAADSKASHRARLTLEPLSKAIGVPIDAQFSETQSGELVAALQRLSPGKQILICWHHGEIPNLLDALGADSKALLGGRNWPDNVYDWVIQLRYDGQARWIHAERINEGLMPGDSGE